MLTILKNRYRVIRKLGSGGFGDTFLAEDIHMPSSRRCVIKQLRPLADEPQVYQLVQARFQREAVILEHLGEGHRQIPRLYAYFEEAGQFYLVEEWIEGTTLAEKVEQEGRLSESSVREILIGILPVLDYVHSQHIVHRDLKPDNIILRDSDRQPVLIDFGAVKETMGTVMTTSGRSSCSIVIGTPGYMPSEQSIGRPVYASDLYSLGLTAIYLLTEKVPQEFKTDPATGEMLWQQHAPMVSPSLAMVLDKAIQSHPRDRYSSAKEMLDALQGRVNTHSPTIPLVPPRNLSPSPAPTTVEPIVNSNRGLSEWQKAVITGSVIGSFILGGLFLYEHLHSQSKQQQSTSVKTPTPTFTPTSEPTPTLTPTPLSLSTPELIPSPSYTPSPPPQPTYYPTQIPTLSAPSFSTSKAEIISESDAISLIEQLYYLLSEKEFPQALRLYSPNLANQFNSDFFSQFDRVSVEDLTITSRTSSSINFIGKNTYVYSDGSTQREKRSYTVRQFNGELKITASEFIEVTKFR